MHHFKMVTLAERPDCIEACAAWAYGRWGVQKKESSLEKALAIFQAGAQENHLPMTCVAINTKTDLPVAMGSLWASDGTEWPNKTPWIASLYTLYRYRGLGLASGLLQRLEREVQRLGFDKVYLHSGSAADFYRQRGYHAIETLQTETTSAGSLTLLVKTFVD